TADSVAHPTDVLVRIPGALRCATRATKSSAAGVGTREAGHAPTPFRAQRLTAHANPPSWVGAKPADSVGSPFHELELMELWDGTGKTRVRQHVNPLRREFQAPTAPPDWSAVFADPSLPLALDIGSGYGRFLLLLQRSRPDKKINYLGVEIRKPLVDRSNAWSERLGLGGQVHYVFGNATVSAPLLLRGYPGPLEEVFIQFPDPHFKRRHHKRRVVQRELVEALGDAMAPGGLLLLQSDIEPVAAAMRDSFEAYGAAAFELAPQHSEPQAVFFSGPVSTVKSSTGNTCSSSIRVADNKEDGGGSSRSGIREADDSSSSSSGSGDSTGINAISLSSNGGGGVSEERPMGHEPDALAAAAAAAALDGTEVVAAVGVRQTAEMAGTTGGTAAASCGSCLPDHPNTSSQASSRIHHNKTLRQQSRGDVTHDVDSVTSSSTATSSDGGHTNDPSHAAPIEHRPVAAAVSSPLCSSTVRGEATADSDGDSDSDSSSDGERGDEGSGSLSTHSAGNSTSSSSSTSSGNSSSSDGDLLLLNPQWAAGGWLAVNPVGVPTEREFAVTQKGQPVYRVLLRRRDK
ncbi:hypothetical protein Agub_g2388, partial [Astrephomene gubernaculifera]